MAESGDTDRALRFPEHEGLMDCPHCGGHDCAFTAPVNQSGHSQIYHTHRQHRSGAETTIVGVRYCRSCGGPVIAHGKVVEQLTDSEVAFGFDSTRETWHCAVVYPIKPTRPKASDELKQLDAGLARDYNEAVACGPHSLQAAAFLLGRCVNRILVGKCEADPADMLGPQIAQAIAVNKIPTEVAEPLQDGFLIVRNQAAHVWVNASGDGLTVDADSMDRCFRIVDALMDHLYILPAKEAVFVAKMAAVKRDKQAGDKSK